VPMTRSVMVCGQHAKPRGLISHPLADSHDHAARVRPPSGWLQMRPSARAPGSPPPRSPQRPPPLDLSAVHGMRLTPDRCSFAGVETPGDQEARGEGPITMSTVPNEVIRRRRRGCRTAAANTAKLAAQFICRQEQLKVLPLSYLQW
jgi:hypothetical protein